MDAHHPLRVSLLVALGAAGCSAPSRNSTSSGDTAVVAIPPVTSSAGIVETAPPDVSAEPKPSPKGWVTEPSGAVHRASKTSCDATIELPSCTGSERTFFCKTDADCKEGPHGKCTTGLGQIGTYCGCEYACRTDAECNAGQACVCKGTGGLREPHAVCAKAYCITDADCVGTTCGLSAYHNGCSEEVVLACRTKEDACRSDKDCGVGSCVVQIASDSGKPSWRCAGRTCVVGRPLVVDAQARVSTPRARDDWRGNAGVDASGLSHAEREALVSHYTAMAALEHASVASFARFSLQLLALGAPAELVADAHRAALDEVEHARVAFAIASHLAGRAIGPGKLIEAAAPLGTSIKAFIEALVTEGCVGETLGAAEGREIARQVKDPALAAALSRIAADEERHAALAWRTLQWALDAFGAEAGEAARRAFSSAAAQYALDPDGSLAIDDFGMLDARTLGAIRREVLAQVVEPCRSVIAANGGASPCRAPCHPRAQARGLIRGRGRCPASPVTLPGGMPSGSPSIPPMEIERRTCRRIPPAERGEACDPPV